MAHGVSGWPAPQQPCPQILAAKLVRLWDNSRWQTPECRDLSTFVQQLVVCTAIALESTPCANSRDAQMSMKVFALVLANIYSTKIRVKTKSTSDKEQMKRRLKETFARYVHLTLMYETVCSPVVEQTE